MVSVRAMNAEEAKKLAARAALDELPDAGIIGLGSGSTARLFIDEVGTLVQHGRRFQAVATSKRAALRPSGWGSPCSMTPGPGISPSRLTARMRSMTRWILIKGGGAAHTREKIVNFASRRNVIVVDASKSPDA